MNTKEWMANLKDDAMLKDIVMPGSHDAGVWATHLPTGNTTNIDKTNRFLKTSSIAAQLGDIKDQAKGGSRWFDIRMYKTPTRWMPWEDSLRPAAVNGHKMKMRAAHVPTFQEKWIKRGVVQSPGLGGYGARVEQILNQAAAFVEKHQSEFIVVRFSHCPEPQKVLKEIKWYLESAPTTAANRILKHRWHVVKPKLADTKMKHLRGKVVMIFDKLFNKHSADTDYSKWMFSYSKKTASAANVCCCGEYADDPDTKNVKAESLAAAETHLAHGNGDGHLCFVYWQLTARLKKQLQGQGDIHQNTTSAAGTHAATGGLMDDLATLRDDTKKNPKQLLVAANVISHDFVNPTVSETIIKGNHKTVLKGNW